jgi:CxxH/CxxC protein (TIGR04129 family)
MFGKKIRYDRIAINMHTEGKTMMDPVKKEYLEHGGDRFIVCAPDQLELALDEFVDEYGEAPDVYLLTEVAQELEKWKAPETCRYSGEKPVYILV